MLEDKYDRMTTKQSEAGGSKLVVDKYKKIERILLKCIPCCRRLFHCFYTLNIKV